MKRIFAIVVVALVCSLSANAVLKEKNLERTLAILRAERTNTHREMSQRMETNKQKA